MDCVKSIKIRILGFEREGMTLKLTFLVCDLIIIFDEGMTLKLTLLVCDLIIIFDVLISYVTSLKERLQA
jgi:hypothetical protein